MPTRTERRAAEHAARKLAYKQSRSQPSQTQQLQTQMQSEPAPAAEPAFETPFIGTSVISEAQLAANRANSQSSTGPKTEQGKLVSSHNALKTGLTGRTIVLPTDDVAAYQSLVALINKKFAPANDIEAPSPRLLLIPNGVSCAFPLWNLGSTPSAVTNSPPTAP